MRNSVILCSLGISIITACSSRIKSEDKDYFEGRILYKNEYVVKTNKVDSDFLNKMGGKTADLYFKEGNYLEKYDSGFMLEQLYRQKENKVFLRLDNSDTLHWYYCDKPGQKIVKSEINPKKEIILGIPCDELTTYYDDKIVSFYYNSDSLRINPDWYKDFTSNNKNLNSQKMKAVYLKYKIERPDFIVTVTATSISRQKIDDNIFRVPENKILIQDN